MSIDNSGPIDDAAGPAPLPSLRDAPLTGERVAFTGTLASMTHRQAQILVEQHGGVATEHVSRQSTMLVIGEEGWPLEADGRPSVKLQQAGQLRDAGQSLRIVGESEWLGFLGLHDSRQEVHRHYTPAMLSQLLNVPVNVIRNWERTGLIVPVSRVYRLPYFDFQEVSSARRLADLIAAGVPAKEIRISLDRLRDVVQGIERPLAQLEILARDHQLVYRDEAGRLKTVNGQRLFDFEPEERAVATESDGTDFLPLTTEDPALNLSPEEWFTEGCRLAENGELAAAVEAYRLCLMDDPANVDAHFQLAETLYRLDNPRGALERYHVVVELDHNFLEAWTQLGCIHAELEEFESALEAFNVALDVHPDYPDALIHRGETLHQLGRSAEAIADWKQYLRYDQRGPWATAARKRLDESDEPLE